MNTPNNTDPPESSASTKATNDTEGFQTPKEFDASLEDLLIRGHDAGIEFDWSWTFRTTDANRPNLMVEITELASTVESATSKK
ncbi:hypothetical protein [Haladaptatus cibarius]|uniref:hypothetical protein n=1 Tax=Haladaptatus cibarius TaxID=453847 RepID=UPI000678C0E0|nr:hypothetical protein [Haladaptatus cibarius]